MGSGTATSVKETARRRILAVIKEESNGFNSNDVRDADFGVEYYKTLQAQHPTINWRVVALKYCQAWWNARAGTRHLEKKHSRQLAEAEKKLDLKQSEVKTRDKEFERLATAFREIKVQRDVLLNRFQELPVFKLFKRGFLDELTKEMGGLEAEKMGLGTCSLAELFLLKKVTPRQRLLWYALGIHPRDSQRDLADFLHIRSAGHINGMLNALEKACLVMRLEGATRAVFVQVRLPDSVLSLPGVESGTQPPVFSKDIVGGKGSEVFTGNVQSGAAPGDNR